MISLLNLRQN